MSAEDMLDDALDEADRRDALDEWQFAPEVWAILTGDENYGKVTP